MEVALVPPRLDIPRRAHVVDVEMLDDESAVVTFDAVNEIGIAKALVGCHCLVPRSCLDPHALEKPSALWDGWAVVDDALGFLGYVADVIENPGQALVEVAPRGAGGSDRSILVPAVDEIIHDVDSENQMLYVCIPDGLADL